jgi:hypothetical protein
MIGLDQYTQLLLVELLAVTLGIGTMYCSVFVFDFGYYGILSTTVIFEVYVVLFQTLWFRFGTAESMVTYRKLKNVKLTA